MLLLLGCAPYTVPFQGETRLNASPLSVDFGQELIGAEPTAELHFWNDGLPVEVEAELEGPFSLESTSLDLGEAWVTLHWTPEPGENLGLLRVGDLEIPLRGEGLVDADDDGWVEGQDCDDADPAINPAATETWNGLDDDCDGLTDRVDMGDLGAPMIEGDSTDLAIGAALVTGGPGELAALGAGAFVFHTVRAGDLSEVVGLELGGITPQAIANPLADLDGDGVAEVLVTSDNNAWLVPVAGRSGQLDLTDAADVIFSGDSFEDSLDRVATGDVDGDGLWDVVVGARDDTMVHSSSWWESETGNVTFFSGDDLESELSLRDGVQVHGQQTRDHLGTSLSLQDLDGDGYAEIIAGAPGAGDAGQILIFGGDRDWGEDEEDGLRAGDVARLTIEGEGDLALGEQPVGLAGDLDGDGRLDLPVGGADAALVVLGAGDASGELGSSEVPGRVIGLESGLGTALDASGDLTGDGRPDLVLGAPDARGGAGQVLLFTEGNWTAGLGPEDATVTLLGENAWDGFGAAVATGLDIDGDGRGDLLVGAPGWDGRADDGGAIYLIAAP